MTNFTNIEDWLTACKDAGIVVSAHDHDHASSVPAYSAVGHYPNDRTKTAMAVWLSYYSTDEADFGLIIEENEV